MNLQNYQIEELLKNIDAQIASNRTRNIFCLSGNTLCFSNATKALLPEHRNLIKDLTAAEKKYLVQYLAEGFMEAFFDTNQYIDFSNRDYLSITALYDKLLRDMADASLSNDEIEARHYNRIKRLIKDTNHFIYELNSNKAQQITPVICAEYSPQFQVQLLQLSLDETLAEPILDIGCGRHGRLVSYLRQNGFEAYGVDRLCQPSSYLYRANWLELDYGKEKWGTILANLSFSSHFINNYLRQDGDHTAYAKTYMRILASLKPRGRFLYAPSLPFIEDLLPVEHYRVYRSAIDAVFEKTAIHRVTE